MGPTKRAILAAIRDSSDREAVYLAGEFVRAAEQEREAILAKMEFEQWLAVSCEECLKAARDDKMANS